MRLFTCQNCGQVVYFENTKCERCGHRLGYLPQIFRVTALEPEGEAWRPLAGPARVVRFCWNAQHDVCNWLIAANDPELFCLACRHNRIIPDLMVEANVARWRLMELAKHRLFYSLLRLRLPLKNRIDDPEHGLAFNFLAADTDPAAPKIVTGHDNGLITIALEEADAAESERRRVTMHEPYRSPLGHFRHEIGHYFWDVLVRDAGRLLEFRIVFGDDSRDYSAALQAHYQNGPPANWQDHYISAYATSHPWEDWAETWAHYLHIVDTVEMASAFGIRVQPRVGDDEGLTAMIDIDPYQADKFQNILDAWLPLTFAMNSINRAMGVPDLYPFVLSPAVINKLDFVHGLMRTMPVTAANKVRHPA